MGREPRTQSCYRDGRSRPLHQRPRLQLPRSERTNARCVWRPESSRLERVTRGWRAPNCFFTLFNWSSRVPSLRVSLSLFSLLSRPCPRGRTDLAERRSGALGRGWRVPHAPRAVLDPPSLLQLQHRSSQLPSFHKKVPISGYRVFRGSHEHEAKLDG